MISELGPYPDYRDSSLPWLGQIPTHWEIRRNGRLFAPRKETGFPDLPILEVSLRTGVRVRNFENSTRKQVMTDRSKYQRARQGDIAYNMMRMWQGAVGVAPTDGLISPAYVVARPYPETNSRYYSYLFRTDAYMGEVDKYSHGIVKDRNRLYWDEFKQMPSPYPPREEQEAMVQFLAVLDQRIRRFIRAKRRLIELLNEQKHNVINQAVTRGLDPDVKLKPSGVEWIGDIPEHWEVAPLKHLAQINSRVLPESTDVTYSFKYFDIGSVGTGCLTAEPEILHFGQAPSRARRILKQGDTILSTVRTYLKAVYYVVEDVKDWIASTGFAVLTPREMVHPPFLGLLILSDNFIDRVIRESVGVAYPAIAETKLGALHLAYPQTIEEQQTIFTHITESTKAIDQAVNRAEGEIALMREYRTRLISDVVTGQVDVRSIEVPEVIEEELPAPEEGTGEFDEPVDEVMDAEVEQ